MTLGRKKRRRKRKKRPLLTVHANGRLFQFSAIKNSNKMRDMRPGPVRKFVNTKRQSTESAR